MVICVQCGYCCTVAPCNYGTWDYINKQCLFLTEDKKCEIYDIVKDDTTSPAMGAGCSSSLFNTVREKKIRDRTEVIDE